MSTLSRRLFLQTNAAAAALAAQQSPAWTSRAAAGRLDQGPFEAEQDDGWMTLTTTTAYEGPLRNHGLGLMGYTWEEGGPSLAARSGKETLEQHVERLSSLPFVDVLYIRCDWRHVQKQAGRLDLHPIWKLTLDAAKARGQRVAFRVQLSNPSAPDEPIAMPAFVRDKVPLVNIGRDRANGQTKDSFEPRYDHPEFRKAFTELNELLSAQFDEHPDIEFVDLMQYGYWGEGHTANLHNPFPDYVTAERTFVDFTRQQLDAWKRTPLAVNTEPDISFVGNRRVIEMCTSAGAWLRSDSILVEEPIQIDMLANRPPWQAVIMEDGYDRQYKLTMQPRLERAMRHVLNVGGNYWSLWTEAANLEAFHKTYPRGFESLRSRMGYRIRPGWLWQRKRRGACELVAAIVNEGVAGVPGVLRLKASTPDGKFQSEGSLDPGHPYAGKLRQCAFPIPRELEGQTLRLEAEIEIRPGVRRPVKWASEPLGKPVEVQLMRWSDPRWRKNI